MTWSRRNSSYANIEIINGFYKISDKSDKGKVHKKR